MSATTRTAVQSIIQTLVSATSPGTGKERSMTASPSIPWSTDFAAAQEISRSAKKALLIDVSKDP